MRLSKIFLSLVLITTLLMTATGCSTLASKIKENVKQPTVGQNNSTEKIDSDLLLKQEIFISDKPYTIKITKHSIVIINDSIETKIVSDEITDAKILNNTVIYTNHKTTLRPAIIVDLKTGISTEIIKDTKTDKLFISNETIYYKDENRIWKMELSKQQIAPVTALKEYFEIVDLTNGILKLRLSDGSSTIYKIYDLATNSFTKVEDEQGNDITKVYNSFINKEQLNLVLENDMLYLPDNKEKPLFKDKVLNYTKRRGMIYYISKEDSNLPIKVYNILTSKITTLIKKTDGNTFTVTSEPLPNIYYSYDNNLLLFNNAENKSVKIAEGETFDITLTDKNRIEYIDEHGKTISIDIPNAK